VQGRAAETEEMASRDDPEAITIGPVGPIPVFDDDDPKLLAIRAARAPAIRKAQAMASADELLAGIRDPDWRVRHEVVDRLIARWMADVRTLPTLIEVASSDSAWQVRDKVALRLSEFDPSSVEPVLRRLLDDPVEDVRWSARFALDQLGLD
jgi:HEAT repeat protein